jgi:hypothetical protein
MGYVIREGCVLVMVDIMGLLVDIKQIVLETVLLLKQVYVHNLALVIVMMIILVMIVHSITLRKGL